MSLCLDETHEPSRTSWVEGADGHPDFPIQNLPLGMISTADGHAEPAGAIGDHAVSLSGLASKGLLPGLEAALAGPGLNRLLGAPGEVRRELRRRLSELLSNPRHQAAVEPHLRRRSETKVELPAVVGDYTDFYVGIHHATNVGRLFRPDAPLLPNYKHVPIGYHGRASSVRPSGEDVVRPNGQRKAADAPAPSFGPSERLDYELELGVWIGQGNGQGRPFAMDEAGEHIAGLCLLNDWSARDLQAWEYQPLGPFLAKSFHTTVSPWIVTTEALEPFRTAPAPRPDGDPRPLPYLTSGRDQAQGAYALVLEAHLSSERMRREGIAPVRLSRGSARDAMYWTLAQIVTHHASNGCNLRPGDLLGTGTLSGADRDGWASLMELSRGGAEPIALPNGETRTFLQDGDEVILTARAEAPGRTAIGFGECRARVLPARAAP